MRLSTMVMLGGLMLGCRGTIDPDKSTDVPVNTDTDTDGFINPDPVDVDLDGAFSEDDCDDNEPLAYPGNRETPYDGIDNDCDALTPDDDLDGDGFLVALDCDDRHARAFPGGVETCDGLDNDCNGTVDDAVGDIWYADEDGDGYGDPLRPEQTCDPAAGSVAEGTDCNDTDDAVFPGAVEVCNERDDDCDGEIDVDAVDAVAWHVDVDEDGYGDPDSTVLSCEQPPGSTPDDSDCDDSLASVRPNSLELCDGLDNDCDGTIDVGAWDTTEFYEDLDSDAYGNSDVVVEACEAPIGFAEEEGDCDDLIPSVFPGNPEQCDGLDNDCDLQVDEDGASATTWHRDLDADGFGDLNAVATTCIAPFGYVADASDCNDRVPTVYPGADELCDGLDNDCDAEIDEGAIQDATWYGDGDGDGFGDEAVTVTSCAQPAGYSAAPGDCDDDAVTVFPGADEYCDSLDNDCDTQIDESDAVDAAIWFLDADEDGHGGTIATLAACEQPAGYEPDADDCNDLRVTVYPGAPELCDGRDNDCNLLVDDGAIDVSNYYLDGDGDGFGDPTLSSASCLAPAGYVANDDDCDDDRSQVRPGGVEVCNGIDDDCDTVVDDGAVNPVTWYEDGDGDGFGNTSSTVSACAQPAGYVAEDDDCDDASDIVNPGADELCDGVDNDCDNRTDESAALDASFWYADVDGDTFGNPNVPTRACVQPGGYVVDAQDCADNNAAVNPDADEVCDGLDNDCNATVDDGAVGATSWYRDADGDGYGDAGAAQASCVQPAGYVLDNTDCDDALASVSPARVEVCDGVDNDCSGTADDGAVDAATFFLDTDEDEFGQAGMTIRACERPDGYALVDTDCDDADPLINPLATEVCDGADNDCSGTTDLGAVDAVPVYADIDGDTWGAGTVSVACQPPAGFSGRSGDCNDLAFGINPGAVEACDSADNDCDGQTDELGAVGGSTFYRDQDGDNYGNAASSVGACSLPAGYVVDNTDCNDTIPSVYPGAPELCDGLDNNCDTQIDEGSTVVATWFYDEDGDGFGDPTVSVDTCQPPEFYVPVGGDCDDTNPTAFPGAQEFCDEADNDCNGVVDEGSAVDAASWYLDFDEDGFGGASVTVRACEAPVGFTASDDDCDDGRDDIWPGADELCDGDDNDCDDDIDEGAVDPATWYADLDGDGFGNAALAQVTCNRPANHVSNSTDCDDTRAQVRPGGVEVCNGLDDDCDTAIDEGAVNPTTWFLDGDRDGYGLASSTVSACTVPTGYAAAAGDCDDVRASDNPGAPEICDGRDNDCDLSVDEGAALGSGTWYRDLDADGFGNLAVVQQACAQPSGYVASSTDCIDNNSAINPDADEVCDGLDNDCNTVVDDGATGAVSWYADADGDRFGNLLVTLTACSQPSGYVRDSRDCDDGNAGVNPSAAEFCDGLDNDCDSAIDDNAADATPWWRDTDGDGFGLVGTRLRACSQPAGYADDALDCNDTAADINPGAVEVCDGLDNDCSGAIDNGATDALTWHRDLDGDTFGNPNVPVASCSQPSGYVLDATDCADTRGTTYPGATELCDGLDNDCDGTVDDGAAAAVFWYADDDGDSFGDALTSTRSCSQPAGYVRNTQDCDDNAGNVNPVATEVCDGVDNNCDTSIDVGAADAELYYRDLDGDDFGDSGVSQSACTQPADFVDVDGDCNDGDDEVNPDAVETCDGDDNDCNGVVDDGALDADTWFRDGDGDGFGDPTFASLACEQVPGFVSNDDDCLDSIGSVYPGAPEVCDGLDNNCNTLVDDGTVGTATWYRDADGDGFGTSGTTQTSCSQPVGFVLDNRDCNDALVGVNPSAAEVCDGVDNDCSGSVDIGAVDRTRWYTDGDGDGVGAGSGVLACSAPIGTVATTGDCDDTEETVLPGAPEVCDGLDNNCNGAVDLNAVDASTWYRDADGDSFGNPGFTRLACTRPSGFVADAQDCLDASAAVYPGAPEVCDGLDNDCDGTPDDNPNNAVTWYADTDADGYGNPASTRQACAQPLGYVLDARDCNDANLDISPSAVEVCDSIDNNCDSLADNNAVDRILWYVDTDDDGYGGAQGGRACDVPAIGSQISGDCDDTNDDAFPGAPEVCDGVDNDCEGVIDGPNPVGAATWYLDFDRDGFAGAGVTVQACSQPANYLATTSDCNDGVATVYPNAPELCDGLDNDCDTAIDENVTNPNRYYLDGDGDGFGSTSTLVQACVNPGGYLTVGGDCADNNPLVNPGASEFCDAIDNNCDSRIDEPESLDALDWYADADLDGYGNPNRPRSACNQPSGHVGDDTDCNDLRSVSNPGAQEICDGDDNDCDTVIDENDAVDALLWFRDVDGDNYGVAGQTTRACAEPNGYAPVANDCDDTRLAVNPAAVEVCDGRDNDCNGVSDGAQAVDAVAFYRDADGDTYGDLADVRYSCTAPPGYVGNDDDCDDVRNFAFPGGTEVCNGIDDDCSGEGDEAAGCPCNVHHFVDGRPYMFCTFSEDWADARDYCYDYGYHMIAINSQVENFWAEGISDSYSQEKWWTGGNDITNEGTWRWENGDPWSFTNWHSGEPNNVGSAPGGEDCLQYNRWGDGTWNDEPCGSAFRFICESRG